MNLEKYIPQDWRYHSLPSASNIVLITESDLPRHLRYSLREVKMVKQSVSIYRIENPLKFLQYELKKLEMKISSGSVDEHFMYHVTGKSNLISICDNNLDYRRVNRAKFGAGVSFTPDVEYGCTYSCYRTRELTVVLLCKVLSCATSEGCYNQLIPKDGCDTTVGNNKKVYVKYEDSSFVPVYAFLLH